MMLAVEPAVKSHDLNNLAEIQFSASIHDNFTLVLGLESRTFEQPVDSCTFRQRFSRIGESPVISIEPVSVLQQRFSSMSTQLAEKRVKTVSQLNHIVLLEMI